MMNHEREQSREIKIRMLPAIILQQVSVDKIKNDLTLTSNPILSGFYIANRI
jgi:hypothetical protein